MINECQPPLRVVPRLSRSLCLPLPDATGTGSTPFLSSSPKHYALFCWIVSLSLAVNSLKKSIRLLYLVYMYIYIYILYWEHGSKMFHVLGTMFQDFCAMTKSSYSFLPCFPPFIYYQSPLYTYLTYFFHPALLGHPQVGAKHVGINYVYVCMLCCTLKN